MWKLWGVVSAYQPDPVTGITFYALAVLSAAVCVFTYLAFMYAAAVGTVGVGVKAMVDHQRR